MATKKEPKLPLDILHCLGKTINCRATLAALCRVSKELNRIFTPLLYRKVHMQDCEYALLERLTNYRDGSFEGFNPNLKFTKELKIGRNLRNYPGTIDAFGEEHDVLTVCLQSMPNLASLSLSTDIDVFNVNRKGISDGRFSFALLQCPENVRDLVLAGSRRTRPFDLPLTGFQNLDKLVLNGVRAKHSADEWINDIVSVLFRSPGLQSLGLSLGGRQSDLAQFIWLGPYERSGCLVEICQRYHAERENRKAPLLSLTELELGNGFLPPPTDPSVQAQDAQSEYLSLLTDLSALRTLKIKNFARHRWDSENTGSNERDNFSAATLHFHAPLLYRAENLNNLSATKVTSDVIRLISHIRTSNSSSNLSSVKFGGTCPSPDLMQEVWAGSEAEFLVHSMHSTGFHWRSLDISDVHTNSSNLINYLKRCKSLEELTCRLSERRLELFKQKVLPRLENLHTLMIGNIQTDNLVDHIFPNPIPRITNVGLELNADPKATTSKSLFKSFTSLSLKSGSQKEWKEELRLREEEARGEKIRQEIALDLLKVSWKAWERRKEEERGTKLKYVGLGYRVYTYMLPGLGEKGKQDRWKVVKLSHDDAMEFGVVRELMLLEDA